jgi:hypothetical protein
MRNVPTGKETGKDFVRLSAADRQAVFEILRETKPDLAEFWKTQG